MLKGESPWATEDDFAAAIDLGIQKGEVVGKRHYENWSGPLGKQTADITLIQGAKSGFGALGLVVSADSKTYLHSAFPVAVIGIVHRVRVLEIHESSFDLEACITAQIGDARIRVQARKNRIPLPRPIKR
jgi:hypothetical protein